MAGVDEVVALIGTICKLGPPANDGVPVATDSVAEVSILCRTLEKVFLLSFKPKGGFMSAPRGPFDFVCAVAKNGKTTEVSEFVRTLWSTPEVSRTI